MKRKVLHILLRQYLKNEVTQRESELFDSWYHSFENKDVPPLDSDSKARILESLNKNIDNKPTAVSVSKISTPKYIIFKVAACIIFLLGFYIFFQHAQYSPNTPKTIKNEIRTFSSKIGERVRIDLPDGSILTLNPNSKIKVDIAGFHNGKRHIDHIRGDVFFEVKSDSNSIFTVNAGELNSKVLGTSFMISSYPELNQQKVSVRSGLVEVKLGHKLLSKVSKSEELIVNRSSQEFKLGNLDIQQFNKRDYGQLLLKQVTFQELAIQINNYFGIQITTKSKKILSQKYTVPIDKNKPIQDLLKAIAELHKNQYRKEGELLIFY